MESIGKNIFCVVLIMLFSGMLLGNTNLPTSYYIDAIEGNDSHSGKSMEAAWKSFKNIEDLTLSPGDHLLLKRGSVFHEILRIQAEGLKGKEIVIDAFGVGEKPRIMAPDFSLYAVLIRNSSYLSVRNLEIVNTGTKPMPRRTGIKVESNNYGVSQNLTLSALDIRDVNGSLVKDEGGGSGMLIENSGDLVPSKFDHLVIEHCTIKRCERNGMIWSANWNRKKWYPNTHVIVRYNSIEEVPGDGIVPIGCDGALIEYNRMSKGPATLPPSEAAAGIWPWSCDNTVIQFNEVSDHKAPWDAQGFDADFNCTNTTIQYNYSHDNDGGFVLICNSGESDPPMNVGNIGAKIQHNISMNDAIRTRKTRIGMFSPSIHVAGPVKDALIANNIIFVGHKPNAEVDRSILTIDSWGGFADNTHVKDNVFIVPETSAIRLNASTNNLFQGNHFFGEYVNLPLDANNKVLEDQKVKEEERLIFNVLSSRVIGDGKDVVTYVDQHKIKDFFNAIDR